MPPASLPATAEACMDRRRRLASNGLAVLGDLESAEPEPRCVRIGQQGKPVCEARYPQGGLGDRRAMDPWSGSSLCVCVPTFANYDMLMGYREMDAVCTNRTFFYQV